MLCPRLILPPAAEPVSLAEARVHLRLDGPEEDALLVALITAARLVVEAASGRLLPGQVWRLTLDRWPGPRGLRLPFSPVTGIVAVRLLDPAGVASPVPDAPLGLEPGSDPPRLLASGPLLPPLRAVGGIEIDVAAGFGPEAGDVPATLRQAMLHLVAHWHSHRGDATSPAAATMPAGLSALILPHRRARL